MRKIAKRKVNPINNRRVVILGQNLTYKRLVNSIDTSPDEEDFDPIRCQWKKALWIIYGNTILYGSDLPSSTGHWHTCVTIHHCASCSLPNTEVKDITSFDDAFHLFFYEQVIVNKKVIVNKANSKIFQALSCLWKKPESLESDKYSWISEIDPVELNALFRLIYFRGLIWMYLHNLNHLFK